MLIGESLVCSFDKKPMELKEICINLRKSAINSHNTSSKDKGQVPTTGPILEFPDSAYDLLKKLLELDSDKRLSAEDALNHTFFKEP